MKKTYLILPALCILAFSSCKKDDKAEPEMINTVPAFFAPTTNADEYGTNAPSFIVHANASDDVFVPWDLDFHPFRENELWVINKGTYNTGGTTVTISNVGTPEQTAEYRKDGNSWHFMALPSAMSFSQELATWCSTAEIEDANRQGGSFTGPSLWSSDMDVYAKPSKGNGSHLDMLHGSPFSMGVEADKNNAFWVFDAYYNCIAHYDFVADHGPGNDDHSDGRVKRYYEVPCEREPGVASHLVMDTAEVWLYIADPKNSRVMRMNTKTGSKKGDLSLINELLAEHAEMTGVSWEVFADINLSKPAGVEIIGNILYVTDNETGEIIAYDTETKEELARVNTGKKGVMGIKADKSGMLWFVNTISHEVISVSPN